MPEVDLENVDKMPKKGYLTPRPDSPMSYSPAYPVKITDSAIGRIVAEGKLEEARVGEEKRLAREAALKSSREFSKRLFEDNPYTNQPPSAKKPRGGKSRKNRKTRKSRKTRRGGIGAPKHYS